MGAITGAYCKKGPSTPADGTDVVRGPASNRETFAARKETRLRSSRRPPGGDARRRRGRGLRGFGAGDRAILHREAALQRAIDLLFDLRRLLARDLRDFRDHQELGAIEHPLFAEREVLGASQEGQAL